MRTNLPCYPAESGKLAAEAIRLRPVSAELTIYGSRMLLMEVGRESLASANSCDPNGRLK